MWVSGFVCSRFQCLAGALQLHMVRSMSVFCQFRSPLVIHSIMHECDIRGFSFHVHNMIDVISHKIN